MTNLVRAVLGELFRANNENINEHYFPTSFSNTTHEDWSYTKNRL